METSPEAGFTAFVEAEREWLARLAVMLVRDRHAAEDLLQETLVRVYLAWHRIDHDTAFAYARRTMTNLATDRWRRSRHEPVGGHEPDRDDDPRSARGTTTWTTGTTSCASSPGSPSGSAPWWCCATTRTCRRPRWPRRWGQPRHGEVHLLAGPGPLAQSTAGTSGEDGMSPIDEDELRRLLRSVEPLNTTDVAAVAIERAGRRRRRRGLTALLALLLSLALLAGALVAVKPRGVEPVVAVAANPYWEPSETAQGRHEEAVVVQAGNRIAWVAQAHGEEQNCGLEASTEIGACGPFASAQAIADRLAS